MIALGLAWFQAAGAIVLHWTGFHGPATLAVRQQVFRRGPGLELRIDMAESASNPTGVGIAETGAGRYQVEVTAGGARFLADEPVAFGGLGSGPNPYDLLGAALGSCTAMTLRLYADRKGWPLARVRVEVSHRRDAPAGRDMFERDISLEGDLDPVQTAKLMEIADRCPVHQTLQRGAEVRTRRVARPSAAEDSKAGQHMRDMDQTCEDAA